MKPKIQKNSLIIGAIGFFIGYSMTKSFFGGMIIGALAIAFSGAFTNDNHASANSNSEAKLDYINEILALVSVILTNDKKLLQSELNYVKRFLNHNFNEEEARDYLLKFREYTKKDLSIDKICVRLNYALDGAGKRQILHLIIGAAVADRELSEAELRDIYIIGNRLNLNRLTVDSLLSLHSFEFKGSRQYQGQGQGQYQRQQQSRPRTSASSINQAYKILEITPKATDAEIKKAYRSLAIIYHPDKVANMGESFQKSAKEKFQKINGAYEQIKTVRGFK
ncbi:hypothetical protein DNU06_02755 [Putridiphycobacter roseus]|uniref:J domain-containing protein n=1 Tax=Putridiphycobacter roseus TaxID=2219161 RepID=A0A2W1NLQ0_9FLAO|nr:DnaJ domain-containing protein [Putridiphycobacter roseus]PZE18766.1 hypothetical protein DNU06_02755 [Putridiphycobacter roseus]